ncbi:MAG TPA: enoyl-CoA hydratase-related protein [Azospirillum sp.]|nr:enoyl-CoA hydratase-related protein [Azospirillum sp.]
MPNPANAAPRVDIIREAPLARIVVDNSARRNALTASIQRQLAHAVHELETDADVSVLALTGAGTEAFVAGADISEFQRTLNDAKEAEHYRRLGDAMLAAVRDCVKPTIAVIGGACMGAGVALAAECDLRYARRGARFGIPAGRLGIGYPVDGTRRLVELAGSGPVTEMFLTGRLYTADEAKAMGLVTDVFDDAVFEAEVRRLALMVAESAPLALMAARLSIRAATAGPPDDEALRMRARTAVDACFASRDLREGWRAFVEKRRPVFEGR